MLVFGGESYSALAGGLQAGLLLTHGDSPVEHHTDSSSVAFINSVKSRNRGNSQNALELARLPNQQTLV